MGTKIFEIKNDMKIILVKLTNKICESQKHFQTI